jgi:hypothetical protein
VHEKGVEHIGVVLRHVAPIATPFLKEKLKGVAGPGKLLREILLDRRRLPLAQEGPDDAVPYFRGIGLDLNLAGDVRLGAFDESRDAFTALIEGPAVITATDGSRKENAPAAELYSPMRAAVRERRDFAVLSGKEDEVFAEDADREGLSLDPSSFNDWVPIIPVTQ